MPMAYAVSIGGEIDIATVSATERAAMVNWLVAGKANPERQMVLASTPDCFIQADFTRIRATNPELKIEVIPVTVTSARTGFWAVSVNGRLDPVTTGSAEDYIAMGWWLRTGTTNPVKMQESIPKGEDERHWINTLFHEWQARYPALEIKVVRHG